MAQKRMFNIKVLDTDAFMDMPFSTQALYFHLCMRADDDGFVSNPRRIQKYIGASDDDLKLLVAKRFVLVFEDGVMVIKHWRMHNTIQKDRYHPTVYQQELSMLGIKDNKAYTLTKNDDVSSLDTNCKQNVSSGLGLGLGSELGIGLGIEIEEKENNKKKKPQKHKYGEYDNVLLTDEELEKLKDEFPDWKQRIENLSEYMASTGKSYKSHLATIRAWARKEKPKKTEVVEDVFAEFLSRGE